MPGEPEEEIALGVGNPQPAGEGLDDLDRRRGGPALLQPRQVVDRDAGKPGQFFSAQAHRSPASTDRDAHGRGLNAIAPATYRAAELPRVHLFTLRYRSGFVLALTVLRKPDDCLKTGVRRRLIGESREGEP